MNNYWIPIEMDDETLKTFEAGLAACYRVHLYTLEQLNTYFIFHAEDYLIGNFRRELAVFLRNNKENLPAQHYSLTRASEKTFPYFTTHKKINKKGKFIFVPPIPEQSYKEIYIEPREVWVKYLALNNLITTGYGTVHLDEQNWQDIVSDQAESIGITLGAVPFYWHSLTLHIDGKKSLLRFNLHDPHTKFGKKAEKEMKEHAR